METAKSASFFALKASGLIIGGSKASGADKGLSLLHRYKNHKRLTHHNASVIRPRLFCANHIWSIDFVHDRLSNGRSYGMLSALEEYTRGALSVSIGTKMVATEGLEALHPLSLKRDQPAYLRSDNGPEFSAAPFRDWQRRAGIQPTQIYPGYPRENGYKERSDTALRHEVLKAECLA